MKWVILSAVIVLPTFLCAQEQLFFEKITDNSSPFEPKVYALMVDSRGFLWIGSDFGLHRYDGASVKDYNPQISAATGFTLPILCIYEDVDASILIGTAGAGLVRLNPRDNSAKKIRQGGNGKSNETIIQCLKSHEGILYVGTLNGIYILNRQEDSLFPMQPALSHQEVAAGKNEIYSIEVDRSGNMWAGTRGGLMRFNFGAKRFESFDLLAEKNHQAIWLIKLIDETIWAATSDGLLQYNTVTQETKFHVFELDGQDKRPLNSLLRICDDNNDWLWVATYGGGLIHLNKKTGYYSIHQSDNGAPPSLSSNFILAVYKDNDNTLWIGSERGINKLVASRQVYTTRPTTTISSSAPKDRLLTIVTGRPGFVWIGTEEGRIYQSDELLNNIRHIASIDSKLMCLYEDTGGTLWIGTSAGLSKYDNLAGEIIQELDVNSGVGQIVEDRKHGLWLTTDNNPGLLRYNPLTKSKKYISNTDTTKRFNVNSSGMTIDSKGNVWIGGMFFLVKYDLTNDKFIELKHQEEIISVIKPDGYSNIWVGNYNGWLLKFDTTGAKVDSIKLKTAYATPTNIEVDINNHLWVSTKNSIIRIDPVTKRQQVVSPANGFQMNDFIYAGSGNGKLTNSLFFAAEGGLIKITPEKLLPDTSASPIVITKFELHGKSETDLSNSIEFQDKINLTHTDGSFTIGFSLLDLIAPNEVEYHFKLKGLSNEWYYSGTQHSASYHNLEPGEYVFTVKADNHNGVTTVSSPLKITILPPWWKTWWAYSAYGIAALLVLTFARKEIIKREQLKAKAKLKEMEAEKYQELDTMKSRFFANISHEFRTPLTLLLGPIEKRLSTSSEPSDKRELATMHKNANRLLTLVNQLLDLSRLESGSLKLKCKEGNLNDAIDFISSQFSSMADSRNIKFTIESQQSIDLYFDFEKLEKIITNLLSNAFKFTHENGSITVSISAQQPTKEFKNGFAAITVKDSGIGIDTVDLTRIFDRFYQVDSSATRQYEGSGIGLALVKELVELHHGTVSVISTPGEGTTFTVHLPQGKDHLSPSEITTETHDIQSDRPAVLRDDLDQDKEDQKRESAQPKILVVEDNADLRHYLRSCLSDTYNILESKDGEEGFSKAVEVVPDLIISDLMMPIVDGIQLTKKLKQEEKTSHIPIILLTAKADAQTKLQGLKTGADDYLTKPFSQDELATRAHNLITIRKNLQKKYSGQLQLMPSQIEVDSMESRFMKKIMTIIEQHLDDTFFGVEVLSQEAAMSNTQLYRKLKSLTGFTPNEVIRNTRLERAASLLQQRAGNVADIAYQVGFNNLSYFSKCFKEKFGVSPSEFALQKSERE